MDGSSILEQAMNTQRSVASFMLRFTQDLWQDENGEPQVTWRGRINHVQGEEEIPFTDFTEALAFIQTELQDLTQKAFPGADADFREKAQRESFRIWEQFAAGYTDLLFKAMDNAFKGSQEIQGRVSEAFAKSFEMWMPSSLRTESAAAPQANVSRETALAEQIQALTAQVAALAEKIQTLESPGDGDRSVK